MPTLFAFVESIQEVDPPGEQGWLGPCGHHFRADQRDDYAKPIEVKLSGVASDLFLDVIEQFEDLTGAIPVFEQRRRRRNQLLQHFGRPSRALYAAFVYLDRDLSRHGEFISRLAVGSWIHIELASPLADTGICPAFVTGEGGHRNVSRTLRLQSILDVDAYVLRRLYDIFSLAHLPDATFRSDSDAIRVGEPPQLPPDIDARANSEQNPPENETAPMEDARTVRITRREMGEN